MIVLCMCACDGWMYVAPSSCCLTLLKPRNQTPLRSPPIHTLSRQVEALGETVVAKFFPEVRASC